MTPPFRRRPIPATKGEKETGKNDRSIILCNYLVFGDTMNRWMDQVFKKTLRYYSLASNCESGHGGKVDPSGLERALNNFGVYPDKREVQGAWCVRASIYENRIFASKSFFTQHSFTVAGSKLAVVPSAHPLTHEILFLWDGMGFLQDHLQHSLDI